MGASAPADLADREWRLIREEARPGPMQMALDEVAAETVAAGGPATVRLYRWRPSTLSLGYRQDPETVDWTACDREAIDVVRRPTGGGAIYHDVRADVSYSIVAPAADLPGDLMACYDRLCVPVLEAFERAGVAVALADEERPAVHEPACYLRALHPAHDVVAADGRKVSGNAQYRRRDAVVQHGSLKYDLDADRHLVGFAADVPPAEMASRVTCVRDHADVGRAAFVRTLETTLRDWAGAAVGGWTDAELDRAATLADERYATEAWTRDRRLPSA